MPRTKGIPELIDEVRFAPTSLVWKSGHNGTVSLDIGVRDLISQLGPGTSKRQAYLENLLAGKHVPLLPDFGLNELVQRFNGDEVDKGVSDLLRQLVW
jgi:hypothetical protein